MAKHAPKSAPKRKASQAPVSVPISKKSKSSSKPSTSKLDEVERGPTGKPKRRPDQPKKVKLRDQKTIPVPRTAFEGQDDGDESDDMMDLGEEEGLEVMAGAGSFLAGLDKSALSRSVKETNRLHTLSKVREPLPKRKKQRSLSVASGSTLDDYDLDSDVESLEEDDEENEEGDEDDEDMEFSDDEGDDFLGSEDEKLNAGYDDISDEDDEEEDDNLPRRKSRKAGKTAMNEEADYELAGRSRWTEAKEDADKDSVEVGRLPIKLPSGEVQIVKGTTRVQLPASKLKAKKPESETEEEEEEEESDASDDGAEAQTMAGVKGRFGRMGIAEIVGRKGWKNADKLDAAKENIAVIGAEILAGGELIDTGPVLTRLSTFALPTVPSMEDGQPPLPVPASIRGLAFLSQLAVYKDLIPGYRIRELTATEQAEKVRDEVRRLREGEKLLVKSYKGYLKAMETEIKKHTALASLSLKCMSDLLSSVPHFNFSENIMGVLVARLGRRTWDADSDAISSTFIDVFRSDISAMHSQTLVRLLARMIKEKKFQVHPNTLSCLLHLRLRGELDKMRKGKNNRSREREDGGGDRGGKEGKKFKSEVRKQWQTKNQRKREKETKEVEKEMAEAEAEVDTEERAQIQTETLKNLFVLYFSILKNPVRSPLLPAALEGISRFAHLVNIDFFRDLLNVLKKIIADQYETEDDDVSDPVGMGLRVRIRLLGIVTAFDLLSGQGEALNIDLSDFINQLFVLLRPLSLDTGIEDPPLVSAGAAPKPARPLIAGKAPPKAAVQLLSTSALLFRSLHLIFFSRHSSSQSAPPWRAAAFAKRLTECALFFPSDTARQALDIVKQLMVKEPKVEALLDTEERTFDGIYKPEIEDPQLVNAFATSMWELNSLATGHWDRWTRAQAGRLRDGKLV
ncbi:nucleolar complex protein 3, partial [Tremellales sp. Uapishka_1]